MTQKKKSILTLLLNVCQVLGSHLLSPGHLLQRLHDPTRGRTLSPNTGRRERDSSHHHLDSKYWVVVLLQLATGGHRVLLAS